MHCYEMIFVHTLDIVLGNKEKLVPRFEIMHTKLHKFKHKGHCSGNHGNHNN